MEFAGIEVGVSNAEAKGNLTFIRKWANDLQTYLESSSDLNKLVDQHVKPNLKEQNRPLANHDPKMMYDMAAIGDLNEE